ncbi:MAG: hypothetical protein HDR01_16010 [Lachnospiraceae bacterium]|nr:hypothetical protein [Lachnospiraceae bacterium]
MDYKNITNNFINEYPDYKSDVVNFNEYVETYWKNSLSGDPLRILLKGIDVDFILKSLIYNVEIVKRYKSKTKAKRYATVVGQLFNYIRKTTDIVNPDLYDAISYNRLRENSYMQQMMSYIDKCEMLAGIVEQEPLTSTEAEKILKWANEQFISQEWEDATSFRKAMAAIGIKMMMLYGITYRELRKIKWSDYDELHDCITVNGYELRLPLKLSVQLKNTEKFVIEKKIINSQNLLFADFLGEPWNDITSSSGIPDYIGALIGITSVTSAVKYGISQLLKAGLSDSVIKKITGASEKLIQGCLFQEDNELKQIVNAKILMAERYYEF